MSERHYTPEQLRTIDGQARLLLSDEALGLLIRRACGACPESRRERARAQYALVAAMRRAPLLHDVAVAAIRAAWREKLNALGRSRDADFAIGCVHDLISALAKSAADINEGE